MCTFDAKFNSAFLLEKGLLASGYNLFFAWTFFLGHCSRYLRICGIKQWRVHKLLLGLETLICLQNACLLLFFKALNIVKVLSIDHSCCDNWSFSLAACYNSCKLRGVVYWDIFELLRAVLLTLRTSSGGVGTAI
jgi:hypothetical protein